jgi:hypothetical protein
LAGRASFASCPSRRADGSKHPSEKNVLHEMRVGDHVVRNVVASVVSVNGDPLLGQTFLSKLPAWSIDNTRQVLVIAVRRSAKRRLVHSLSPTLCFFIALLGMLRPFPAASETVPL